jgi:hypothetical protein
MMKKNNDVVSSQEEIQDWLTTKEHEFSQWENQGLNVNVKRWKEKYIYTDMHEIFFLEFSCLLYEWLKRHTIANTSLRPQEPMVWDQITNDKFNTLNNKWTQAIDLWFS